MVNLINVGVVLILVISGLCSGSEGFVRIEKLSDRVIIGHWLGTGRMNIVAIKSQNGLTLEQAKDRFAVHKKFPRFYQKQTAEWSRAKQDRNITVLWRRLEEAEQKSQTLN